MYLYKKPISMPRGSHYGSDYWLAYSYKLKRQVEFHSMLEFYQFVRLEMDPTVEYFCEQPVRMEFEHEGKMQESIPDFWVYFRNASSEFQEIKSSQDLKGDHLSAERAQKQIDIQKKWCEKYGIVHKVITEEDIFNNQYRMQNLKILHSHLLRAGADPIVEKELLCKELRNGVMTVEMIFRFIKDKNITMQLLAKLLYNGEIDIELDKRPIDKHTEVSICEKRNIILLN